MKKFIPSLITLMNLACGLVALILVLNPITQDPIENSIYVAGLMLFAMLCDIADGMAARLLKVTTEIGKQLDSLADMVTFGVLPGVLVFFVLKNQVDFQGMMGDSLPAGWVPATTHPGYYRYLPWIGVVIPLFSALRLAKFNVDTKQTSFFRGFPTPPNAFLFLSIYLMYSFDLGSGYPRHTVLGGHLPMAPFNTNPTFFSFLYDPLALTGLTLLFSVLLVTNLPLMSSKLKDFSLRNNWPLYLLVGISLILLLVLWYKAVPIVIVLYFIFSFIDRALKKP